MCCVRRPGLRHADNRLRLPDARLPRHLRPSPPRRTVPVQTDRHTWPSRPQLRAPKAGAGHRSALNPAARSFARSRAGLSATSHSQRAMSRPGSRRRSSRTFSSNTTPSIDRPPMNRVLFRNVAAEAPIRKREVRAKSRIKTDDGRREASAPRDVHHCAKPTRHEQTVDVDHFAVSKGFGVPGDAVPRSSGSPSRGDDVHLSRPAAKNRQAPHAGSRVVRQHWSAAASQHNCFDPEEIPSIVVRRFPQRCRCVHATDEPLLLPDRLRAPQRTTLQPLQGLVTRQLQASRACHFERIHTNDDGPLPARASLNRWFCAQPMPSAPC